MRRIEGKEVEKDRRGREQSEAEEGKKWEG